MNLTFIAEYDPTLDAVEETKYSFNDDLQDAVGGVPAGNMVIIAEIGMQGPVPWTRKHDIPWTS